MRPRRIVTRVAAITLVLDAVSIGSFAVGARGEVQYVAEVRGQVSVVGVAEVVGHCRDIEAGLTSQPLGRFLKPAAADHRCRGRPTYRRASRCSVRTEI